MNDFPDLQSRATVQYPVRRDCAPLGVIREFWGGGCQTYQRRREAPFSWTLQYDGLSEEEVYHLLVFCEQHASAGTYFPFTDPITGVLHNQCTVEAPSVVAVSVGVNSYTFRATVRRIEG